MKTSKVALFLALAGLGLAGRSASAITLTVLSMDPGSVAPVLTYSAGLISVAGNFNLTGLDGVVIPPADQFGVTITFTGFSAAPGTASTTSSSVTQVLSGGTFTLTNSLSQVILTGTAGTAILTAGLDSLTSSTNDASGNVLSLGDVAYTPASGPNTLQPAINAAGLDTPGTVAFALTGFDDSNPVVVGGTLLPFHAGVSGQIAESTGSGTPPPGAPLPAAAWSGLSMLGTVGGIGAVVRRRRR